LEKFCRACWIDLSWEVAIVLMVAEGVSSVK
jgi:hypothetical protein